MGKLDADIRDTDDCVAQLNSLLEECHRYASVCADDYEAVEYATERMRTLDELEYYLLEISVLSKTVTIEDIMKIIS